MKQPCKKLLFISVLMISGVCSANAGNHIYSVNSLNELRQLDLMPGDVVELESGKTYEGMLELTGIHASGNPVIIRSSGSEKAVIDGAGHLAAVLIQNCSGIVLDNLAVRADGSSSGTDGAIEQGMRCGVLVRYTSPGHYSDLTFTRLDVRKVYYYNPGYVRSPAETLDGRSRSQYGWGIRFFAQNPKTELDKVTIRDCEMTAIAHTAIKIKAANLNVHDFEICNNHIYHVGGPGIQMSGVKKMHIHHNTVDHPGSVQDTRNWGRGSGYWCWGSEDILVEHNHFTHANGPQDSAGAHIDYNNNNVIYQYNYSAYNDGGFVEILGNNYNCMYRFNISVNDGIRTIGTDHAVNNGAMLMLTGFVGKKVARKGPYSSYIYNNTIYVDKTIIPKLMLEKTIAGLLISNNIFHLAADPVIPKVQRYLTSILPDNQKGIYWKHNLYLRENALPEKYVDMDPIIGDPGFSLQGEIGPEAFIPEKSACMDGIRIEALPSGCLNLPAETKDFLESKGTLRHSLNVTHDFFGRKIRKPFMGAVRPR